MADWGGLENRCASDRTEGSNPSLSARYKNQRNVKRRSEAAFDIYVVFI